jgi:hypothetical protein
MFPKVHFAAFCGTARCRVLREIGNSTRRDLFRKSPENSMKYFFLLLIFSFSGRFRGTVSFAVRGFDPGFEQGSEKLIASGRPKD